MLVLTLEQASEDSPINGVVKRVIFNKHHERRFSLPVRFNGIGEEINIDVRPAMRCAAALKKMPFRTKTSKKIVLDINLKKIRGS